MGDAIARMHQNANLVLWCVVVLGPGDVFAAFDYEFACKMAERINEDTFARDNSAQALCFAYPAPWPYDDRSHAEDLRVRTVEGG
jgi:hypothetical protein